MLYYAGCYITKIEIKDYNFLINERNVFDQFVKNDLRAYGNIKKKKQLIKEMITQLAVY